MPRKLKKEAKEFLSPKPWFVRDIEREQEREDIELEKLKVELSERAKILNILAYALPGLISLTLVIIVMDGFRLWGFDLDTTTANILAGTVIPEALGLLAIALRGAFSKPSPG